MGAGPSIPNAKSSNVELNLVPFIDPLSSLVLFLLLTTVWMKLSSVQAGAKEESGQASSTAVAPASSTRLYVHLTKVGIQLHWPTEAPSALPKEVSTWTELVPQIQSTLTTIQDATVSATDDVPYSDVIEALDRVRDAGVSTVSLNLYRK